MKDLPLGNVSLKGKLLLGVINDDQIRRWISSGGLESDFEFSPMVAFGESDGRDFLDLRKTMGLNEAIVYQRACADLLNSISPAELLKLCNGAGRQLEQMRMVLVLGDDRFNTLMRLFKDKDPLPTELGSFRYDGNLTVEYLGPYKCMEAKDASKKKGKACLL